MKWSFILFLPAIVSALWAIATLLLRRKITHAQVLLSLTLLLEAFALTVLSVFFRGKAGGLFIYDYIFDAVTLFVVSMYYMGICSLTGPRGVTLVQRRTFVVPIVYVLVLTVLSYNLGPRRYEELCHAIVEGTASFKAGDAAWNHMLFMNKIVFPLMLFIYSAATLVAANRKFRVFASRFNTFYAGKMNLPQIKMDWFWIICGLFFVFGGIQVMLIDYRPYHYKYWLIACAVLMTVLQFFFGRQVFNMKYDARYIARLNQ